MAEYTDLSGCAIIDSRKLLVLWKIKRGYYEFPGGKVELGESLEQAALREVKEELGVDVRLGKYLGFEEFEVEGRKFRSHKFIGRIIEGQKPRVNEPEKFRELFWLPFSDYLKHSVAPNVREFCDNVNSGRVTLE
jgi:8-oxo-dGTP pyrophosphatase MutT (NUDIX family)